MCSRSTRSPRRCPNVLAIGEREARVARVGELVRASGSDVGMVIDPGGETATLVDGSGRALDDHQKLGALLTLAVSARPDLRVALPVSASRAAARIVAAGGGEVVWTKTSASAIMEVASRRDIDLAAGADGSVVWPEFLPAFDAAATFVHLLDLLARVARSLAEIVDDLEPVHMARRSVPVEWSRKGSVMRELVERNKGRGLVLVDGVKVDHDDGWALVLPDPDDAVVHILVEAANEKAAVDLADHYAPPDHRPLRPPTSEATAPGSAR